MGSSVEDTSKSSRVHWYVDSTGTPIKGRSCGKEYSSLTIEKPLDEDGRKKLMDYLESTDVSELEHLRVLIDDRWRLDSWYEVEMDGIDGLTRIEPPSLGAILGTGRFSALKKLEIRLDGNDGRLHRMLGVGSASLAAAFRTGKLRDLRELYLDVLVDATFHFSDIFEALVEGGFTQLTSLSTQTPGYQPDNLDTVQRSFDALWKNECLRNLRHLEMRDFIVGLESTVFTRAIKSGLLPNLVSLVLSDVIFSNLLCLADLVEGTGNWFRSLECLHLSNCHITSEKFCAFVDAVMKLPNSRLALKVLNLGENYLDNKAVDALANLVESGRLPQLQKLDLSWNSIYILGADLARLMETIQRGHLPGLKEFGWTGNKIGRNDEGATAVAQAYFENVALTADIQIEWHRVRDQSLMARAEKYKERNRILSDFLNNLEEEFKIQVPLNSAKVFICGFPEVGKTTLRKALGRPFGFRTKFVLESRKLFKEPRTKGIELSRIQDEKNTSLTFWDLAGQEEYHVLHGAFLADLGSVGSKATIFVIVFKVPFEKDVEAKLLYWLKFVASSSLKYVKRHVLTVLNRFDGGQCSDPDKVYWMDLIGKFAAQFTDVLYIHLDPFIIDARFAESVQQLKSHLFEEARRLLDGVKIPKACFELLNDLRDLSEGMLLKERVLPKALKGLSRGRNPDRNKSPFPIFTWQAFEESWKIKYKAKDVPTKNFKICASYLHEIGEIIYFDRMKPSEPESESRSIVVADAQWFCRDVVGKLLLPENMLKGGSSIEVSADGSISLIRFQSFFQSLLPKGTQSDDVVSMLEQVGLCYRKGAEEIIVPALIREDDYTTLDWEGQGFHGVMGRSLATEDKDRSAIPETLFRQLQVELAQDPRLGGREDSAYRAGKSFVNFKLGELLVLVQFDVDHSDPSDDRIDILVKSVLNGTFTDVNLAKINCICEILQKLERLCVTCCPGLTYEIQVIQPWNATEATPKMTKRQLISLTKMKDLLVKGNEYSSWKLSGHPVELKAFLSESELKGVLGTAERDYDEWKQDAVSLGLLTEESLQKLEEFEQENGSNAQGLEVEGTATKCPNDDGPHSPRHRDILNALHQHGDLIRQEGYLTRKTVRDDGHLTRQYVEKSHQVLFSEIRHKQNALVRLIEAQQEFCYEEREKSVPRFIFLSRKQGNSNTWITLREALAINKSFELHFLCEAHFDHGSFHEVDGQEGIKLTKPKEWLVKISPWLRRSLQVAIMVGKTVGNVYLPGVFNFIPDFNYLQDEREGLSKAVDTAATMMLEENERVNHVQGDHSNYGTAAGPVDLRERMIAEGVVKDLIRELGEATFMKKIGLKKVLLRAAAELHVGSSMQAQPSETQASVRWICHNCYKFYGNRARAIA